MKIKINKYIIITIFMFFSLTIKAQIENIGYPFIRNYEHSEYQAGLQSWMISQADNGLIYFANNSGLLEFDGQNWQLHKLFEGLIVRSLFVDSSGKIFVGTVNDFGYFEPEGYGSLTFKSLIHKATLDEKNFEEIWKIHKINERIVFQSYNQLLIYQDDTVKVIKAPNRFHFSFTVNDKLLVVDEKKGILQLIGENLQLLENTDFFINKEITSILPYDNNLLITTLDDGVYLYENKKVTVWNNELSNFLKKNQIYCAIKISKDEIAFGTVQNGLIISTKKGRITTHINESKGLQNNTILCLFKDKNKNLWVGTDNGIDLLKTNLPFKLINKNNGISAGYTAVFHNNIIYVGTNRGVFYKKLEDLDSNLISKNNFSLIEKTKGQVWKLQVIDNKIFCAHNNGAYIINDTSATKISDIPGFWTFLQTNKNTDKIIAGTYTGLVLFEKKDGKWGVIKKLEGFDQSCRVMQMDNSGNLWMSHVYKGVFHLFFNEDFDKITEIKFYGKQKGFLSNIGINVTKLQNKILFLSSNGVYSHNKETDSMEIANEFQFLSSSGKITYAIQNENGDIWTFFDKKIQVLRFLEDGSYSEIKLPFYPIQGKFIDNFEFEYSMPNNNILIGYENGFIIYNPQIKKDYRKDFKTYIHLIKNSSSDSTLFIGKMFNTNKEKLSLDYKNNGLHFFFSAIDFENPDKLEFSTYLKGYEKKWSEWKKLYDREFTNLKEGDYSFYLKAKNVYGVESKTIIFNFTIKPPFYRTKLAYITYLLLFLIVLLSGVYFYFKRIKKVRMHEKEIQKQKYEKKESLLKQEALIAEKKIIELNNNNLRQEMRNKNKELAEITMQTIRKNKFLISLKNDLIKMSENAINKSVKVKSKSIIKKINNDINNEQNWTFFEKHFLDVHDEFITRFQKAYPNITPAELRLCACLRMNLSTKEIASLFNLSIRGVETSRYRLRKNLNLDRQTNLTNFILSF